MSEIKTQALEFASRIGHATVEDLLAAAGKVEAWITGGTAPAATGKGKSKPAAPAATEVLPGSAPAAPAPTPAAAPAAPAAPAAAAPAASAGSTKEDVRLAFLQLIQKNARAEVERIQQELGAAKLSDIKPEQYADAIKKAGEALLLL